MYSTEWIAELKPGDSVIVANGPLRSIYKVTRVTKTMVIIGKSRFSRKTGRPCGDSGWDNHSYLIQATEENMKAIQEKRELQRHLRIVSNVKWRHVPLDTLKEIVSVLIEKKVLEEA